MENLLVVAVVSPPLGQELLVRPLLHEDPALHEHDVVGLLHRLQLMGHHQQVSPPLGKELLVRPLLHEDPALHEHDVVGLLHCLQLMGHHQQEAHRHPHNNNKLHLRKSFLGGAMPRYQEQELSARLTQA
ncbi:hypothetical protein CRUP_023294 [Coryphaenoides rupestris]|nr:hypothetical protein CRUP_023294 [Coryphaenoides rupestris]